MATFQDKYIPTDSRPAGLAYLLQELKIRVPLAQIKTVSNKTLKKNEQHGEWEIFTNKYWPGDDLYSHLVFSFKYEVLNLLALKFIFSKINPHELEKNISASPTSTFARKIWFLYEWLTTHELKLEDIKGVTAVKLLDEEDYFTGEDKISLRHRVINNFLGDKDFCPIIQKTEKLKAFMDSDLKAKTENIVSSVDRRLIARAASFLLLADTKATYEIEGERAPQNRLERWAKVIMEAGKNDLSLIELERLHRILLKDDRFTRIGVRDTEVFLGDRDHQNHPLPEFIGARQNDLLFLMGEWIGLNKKLKSSQLDPILQAVLVAFTFVYIHPLQDGNGRLHRYFLHHVLADRGFTPKGIIFPVSSVMLDHIEEYKNTLTTLSGPLQELIEWETDEALNVKILNETRPLYQYLNLTDNCEFIYKVVKQTIEVNLPEELQQLKKYDKAKESLSSYIEMPEGQLSLLINVIKDNDFKLSKAKKAKFFGALKEKEIQEIEALIKEAYE